MALSDTYLYPKMSMLQDISVVRFNGQKQVASYLLSETWRME